MDFILIKMQQIMKLILLILKTEQFFGPALTQTIKVNKYRGEVIDSYTNATDEEMKQFNKAKRTKVWSKSRRQ